MNIKTLINLSLCLLAVLFVGCKRTERGRLADSYYGLAINALDDTFQSYKIALPYIDQAIASKSKAHYFALKATLLLKLNRADQAEDLFKKALGMKSDFGLKSEILNNYACLLSGMGRVHEANSIWENLIDDQHYLTPELALFNQAKLLVGRKYYKLAQSKLSEAIAYAPSYVDAHYYLAIISKKYLADADLAKRELGVVLGLEPLHKGATELLKLV